MSLSYSKYIFFYSKMRKKFMLHKKMMMKIKENAQEHSLFVVVPFIMKRMVSCWKWENSAPDFFFIISFNFMFIIIIREEFLDLFSLGRPSFEYYNSSYYCIIIFFFYSTLFFEIYTCLFLTIYCCSCCCCSSQCKIGVKYNYFYA